MLRFINNELRETKLVQTSRVGSISVDYVYWLYKGKEPVYYAFESGSAYNAICNGLTLLNAQRGAEQIIRNAGERKTIFWEHPTPTPKKALKSTYFKLKILKFI